MNRPTAAKFDTNIRALRGTVMSLPVNNPSTESDYYVGLPTAGVNSVPTGVLAQDVVEPGYPITSELFNDPNTGNPINGSVPPSPFISQGRAWGLHRNGDDIEVIAADTTLTQDCDVIVADNYGRVTNISAIGVGQTANVIGRAKYASTAVNQRVRIILNMHQVKT
jgi:hypothetical protein